MTSFFAEDYSASWPATEHFLDDTHPLYGSYLDELENPSGISTSASLAVPRVDHFMAVGESLGMDNANHDPFDLHTPLDTPLETSFERLDSLDTLDTIETSFDGSLEPLEPLGSESHPHTPFSETFSAASGLSSALSSLPGSAKAIRSNRLAGPDTADLRFASFGGYLDSASSSSDDSAPYMLDTASSSVSVDDGTFSPLGVTLPGNSSSSDGSGSSGGTGNTRQSYAVSPSNLASVNLDDSFDLAEGSGDSALSTANKSQRKQSESRLSLPQLYDRMGLGHDRNEAQRREQRILDLLKSEGFKLGEKTWIRDTSEKDRKGIIDKIYSETFEEYSYSRELIETIVRRGTYYQQQGRLRRERRSRKV